MYYFGPSLERRPPSPLASPGCAHRRLGTVLLQPNNNSTACNSWGRTVRGTQILEVIGRVPRTEKQTPHTACPARKRRSPVAPSPGIPPPIETARAIDHFVIRTGPRPSSAMPADP